MGSRQSSQKNSRGQRIFSHKAAALSSNRRHGHDARLGDAPSFSSNPPGHLDSESGSVSFSHSFTLAGTASSSPTPPLETVLKLLGEPVSGRKKGKKTYRGDESRGSKHRQQPSHPQPRKRAPLGFSLMPTGGVA